MAIVLLEKPFPVGLVYKQYVPLPYKSYWKRFLWSYYNYQFFVVSTSRDSCSEIFKIIKLLCLLAPKLSQVEFRVRFLCFRFKAPTQDPFPQK